MQRLARVSVLNAAFHVSSAGHLGTVNGLRLGRTAAVPVDWAEINAALGLSLALTLRLRKCLGLPDDASAWTPIPLGAASKVIFVAADVAFHVSFPPFFNADAISRWNHL